MRHSLLVLIAFLALPSLAQAQTATSYTLKIFNQGAAQPITTTALPATGFTCGLAKAVVLATTHNPTTVNINDPADATKDCQYVDPGTGPLLSLPFGTNTYVATLSATNPAGTTADSGSSNPFDHAGTIPQVPANVRIK
jgi:hypothetical protein